MCIETEAQMEQTLIDTLVADGYEEVKIRNEKELLSNLKTQLERHNNVSISDENFKLILNHLGTGDSFEKAQKLRDRFPIELEDGTTKSIEFLDSHAWCKNSFQVTHQVTIKGKKVNRYDVTILINGLPLVQIELKKRGIPLHKAQLQIERYKYHSFNENYALFGYIQIFVISNGSNTKYYANNTKANFKQTFFWADENKNQIRDIKAFSKIFLEKCHLSKMICKYTVLTTQKTLMILRPYQFNAIEKILNKVENSNDNAYIWHTTGSGKTLTSFKVSQLLCELAKVDKVVFVVDRKDLDIQTKKEFNKFKAGSVDSTDNTKELVSQFQNKVSMIVTTIQKLNTAISKENYLKKMEMYKNENIIFIFDECHRSQFGQAHAKIVRYFPNAQMIGFTGTPILDANSISKRTTGELFGGDPLDKYLIPDAIGDDNVLGFVVEYRLSKEIVEIQESISSLVIQKKETKDKNEKQKIQEEINLFKKKIKTLENSHKRVESNVEYIVKNHNIYTAHNFTAMMTVSSVDMLIAYYDTFKKIEHNLKIATIFSYNADDENDIDIEDGNIVTIDVNNIDVNKKNKLESYIKDYNNLFETNYSTDVKEFYNYYDDISSRVKKGEIDILLVVNMFLTGFDSPKLNTLYVDKTLQYHGLIQAFSRTNRIYEKKEHGKIVCFRDLQFNTEEAIKMFSDKEAISKVLRDSYEVYLKKFNIALDKLRELVNTPEEVQYLKTKKSKLDFVNSFKDVLRLLDVMKTFVEFTWNDIDITAQEIADYTSFHIDIYYEYKQNKNEEEGNKGKEDSELDIYLAEADYALDLVAEDTVDLVYILKLLFNLKDDEDEKRINIYNIIRVTPSLYKKKEIIEEFIDYFKTIRGNIENIEDEYSKFSENKKNAEFEKFCIDYGIELNLLQKIIYKYIEDGKDIQSDAIANLLIKKPTLKERMELIPIIRDNIMQLIYKFEEM